MKPLIDPSGQVETDGKIDSDDPIIEGSRPLKSDKTNIDVGLTGNTDYEVLT